VYIRLKTSAASRNPTVQIVQSFRQDGKVKQKIVASLGVIRSPEDKQRLVAMAQALIDKMGSKQLDLIPPELSEAGRPIEQAKPCLDRVKPIHPKDLVHVRDRVSGFHDVYSKLMDKIGFSSELSTLDRKHKHAFKVAEIIPMLIEKRLQQPASKRRSLFMQALENGTSSCQLHQIYRAMDVISPFENKFQSIAWNAAADLLNQPIECLFYDATTLYFESVNQDEIKKFGFSKDGKAQQVQIVFCLMVTHEGIPVGYEIFPGNTGETKTLRFALEELSKRANIQKVTVVCDRGMLSGDINQFIF